MPHPDTPAHRRAFRILVAAGKEFGADNASRLSAALSFFTLFSLVPILFLVLAVVGFVSSESLVTQLPCDLVTVAAIPEDPGNPIDRFLRQIDDVAGREVSSQFADLTCEASNYASQALGIGIALVAFSASTIFLHIQGVLNFLFHAPEDEVRGLIPMLWQRGVALVSSIVLAALMLTPVVAVASINFVQDMIAVTWLRRVLGVGVPLTSLLLMVTVVTLTFRWLTRAYVPWKAARRGGLFTAVTGLAGAFLVGAYLNLAGGEGALGAVGGVAILLFFFNLMWMIYLFGVEVTKVYADYLEHGDVLPPSERPGESVFDGADQEPDGSERAPETEGSRPKRGAVMAFLAGLATGWAARRRDS